MVDKQWNLIPKPKKKISTKDNFETFQAVVRKGTDERRQEIAKMLDENPVVVLTELAEKYRVNHMIISRDIEKLAAEGHRGAIENQDLKHQIHMATETLKSDIKQFYNENPGASIFECAKHLRVSAKTVQAHVAKFSKEDKDFRSWRFVNITRKTIIDHKRKIAEYWLKHPTASQSELARVLKIPQRTVSRYMREMMDDYQAAYVEQIYAVRCYCSNELLTMIQELKEHGNKGSGQYKARAAEVMIQALRLFMRLHNIDQPDTQVNVQMNISQSQRDAVAMAAARGLQISEQLKIPQFDKEDSDAEEAIDV